MAKSDLLGLLHEDRLTWELDGVLPGEERLRLCLEDIDRASVGDADLVFAWAAWAMITSDANDDEDAVEREIILDALIGELAIRAVPVPSLADDLGRRVLDDTPRTASARAFTVDDGGVIHVERNVLDDGRRVLVCRADRPEGDAIEGVLVSDGAHQIRSLRHGSPRRTFPFPG